MSWTLTDDIEHFAPRVWDLLAGEPARHTIALTVIDSLRAGRRFSADPMLFGVYEDASAVRGAVLMTPPFELLLAAVPADTTAGLVAALREAGVAVPGANGEAATVDRFATAWTEGRGLPARVATQLRLYELGSLRPPHPPPAGRPRAATGHDLGTAVAFLRAFEQEIAGHHATDVAATARERIADERLWLWEDASGAPASLAARTRTIVGVARIAPVYTPPQHRRRGYGTAITAACADDALHRGADHVVLFTDLANPTSNRIYQQIGFEPRGDSRVVRFAAA